MYFTYKYTKIYYEIHGNNNPVEWTAVENQIVDGIHSIILQYKLNLKNQNAEFIYALVFY